MNDVYCKIRYNFFRQRNIERIILWFIFFHEKDCFVFIRFHNYMDNCYIYTTMLFFGNTIHILALNNTFRIRFEFLNKHICNVITGSIFRAVSQLLLSHLWFDFAKYCEAQYCNLQRCLQIAAKASFQQVAESWWDVYQLQGPDVHYCA